MQNYCKSSNTSNIAIRLVIQLAMATFFCTVGTAGVSLPFILFDSKSWELSGLTLTLYLLSVVGVLISLCLLGIGFLLALASFRTLTQSVAIDASGISVRRLIGSSAFHWSELEAIQVYSMHPTASNWFGLGALYDTTSLFFSNGRTICVGPEISRRYKLGLLANRIFLKTRVAWALAEINSGQNVSFGLTMASSSGLHRGNMTLRWDGIRFVCLRGQGSELEVAGENETWMFPIEKTGNVLLLICIIVLKSNAALGDLPEDVIAIIEKYCPNRNIAERTMISPPDCHC